MTASTSVPATTWASSRVSTSAGIGDGHQQGGAVEGHGQHAAATAEVLRQPGDRLGVGWEFDEVAIGEVEDAGEGAAQVRPRR